MRRSATQGRAGHCTDAGRVRGHAGTGRSPHGRRPGAGTRSCARKRREGNSSGTHGGASAGPPGVRQVASVSSSGIRSWAWDALPGQSPRAATPDDTMAKVPEQIEGGSHGGTWQQRCDSASTARPLLSEPPAHSLGSPLSSVSPPARSPRARKGVGSSVTAETQGRGWVCAPGAEAPPRACAPPSSRPRPHAPACLCPGPFVLPSSCSRPAWECPPLSGKKGFSRLTACFHLHFKGLKKRRKSSNSFPITENQLSLCLTSAAAAPSYPCFLPHYPKAPALSTGLCVTPRNETRERPRAKPQSVVGQGATTSACGSVKKNA